MSTNLFHREWPETRRDFLSRAGCGFGGLACSALLEQTGYTHPASGTPHRAPTAKQVIFVFVEGGPSHLDLFDPKPELNRLAGQRLPESFGPLITAMGEVRSPLLASRRTWKQHGESGIWISDWLPQLARHADELCVIRSCWADGLNHVGSVCQMNTGSVHAGRPALGSWITYGLGTENENLPAFCVLLDNPSSPLGGHRNWGTGFMPATYQGMQFVDGSAPIPNLAFPKGVSPVRQSRKQALLRHLNQAHARRRGGDDELDARIKAFELAFRMQSVAPQVVDLKQETTTTHEAYGTNSEKTRGMARACLLARRLVECGVRFVQIYCGAGSKWDAHAKIEGNHTKRCLAMDQPVAALLEDLKQRGLLDETLVVWGGEFGRTPMSEKGNGRDHNPYGFTMWMAGGGVRAGHTVGATDELGLRAVSDRVHVHDLHATILHALGLNHLELTYAHQGRGENPTINSGSPVLQAFS